MLIVCFGVNACGKDTLFKNIQQNLDIIYVSASQILMKSLGIIDEILEKAPTRENYKTLECVSDEQRNIIMATGFFDEIKNIERENPNKTVVIPMHLCIIKEQNNSYNFDLPDFPYWFEKIDKFIYIRTPLLNLENRISKDSQRQTRERLDAVRDAKIQQLILSEKRFKKIKEQYTSKCYSLSNSDRKFESALIKLENLLNLNNISDVQHFPIH